MEQLGSHWTDFHEILYFIIFRKCVEKIRIKLERDKNSMYSTVHVQYFTCTVLYMYSTLHVQYFTCTVLYMYSTLHVQYVTCTVLYMYSTLHEDQYKYIYKYKFLSKSLNFSYI